jgi:hypothetical protein
MNLSPNFVRLSKYSALGCALLLGFTGQVVRADLPRTAISGIPRVLGREIECFILLAPIVVDRSKAGVRFADIIMVRMVPGTFVPVSEDAGGIFYQAVNGFLEIRGSNKIGGGVYVSKSQPGMIWVYVGNAGMSSKRGVEKDRLPLPASALRSLHVGKAAPKK